MTLETYPSGPNTGLTVQRSIIVLTDHLWWIDFLVPKLHSLVVELDIYIVAMASLPSTLGLWAMWLALANRILEC